MSDTGEQTLEPKPPKIAKRASNATWRGNRYPTLRQRGYYSDVASKENMDKVGEIFVGPSADQCHSWNTNKDQYVPQVNTFNMIDKEVLREHLKNQVHGATTEVILTSEFTTEGYLPKVFLPFYTPPGELPRKVQIDRLKRLYLSMNVADILEKKGLEPEKLMPINRPDSEKVILNEPNQDPAPFQPFLPLHFFDDDQYEIWTPEEWLRKGVENNCYKPVPGRSLLPDVESHLYTDPKSPHIQYSWQQVGILDYDSVQKLWLVQKLSSGSRLLDEYNHPMLNKGVRPDGSRKLLPTQYWVPRIQLHFLAEDPRIFAERVERAYNDRKLTEAYLRYELYIDLMPKDGVIELDQTSFKRMLKWCKGASGLKTIPEKNREDTVEELEKEINLDFQRSMNKITFNSIVKQDPETFAFVTIPPEREDKVPERGCTLDVPQYDFDEKFYNFSFVSLVTRAEAIDALVKLRVECNRVTAMSLFQIPNKYMKIDEFEQTQNQQISQVSLYLKDSWINSLKKEIRSSFADSGKGWFNIRERDWSVYQISKLKKFMEMVKFSMQDSLRYLVQDSLVSYTQMVVDSCWQVVDIKDDYSWTENDLINSYIKPKRNPVFLIDLIIDKDGPKYNTPYENFENVLCNLFEKAIQSTLNVPQMEKYVMEDIFWSGTPLLESVGKQEPHILELKKTIIHMINLALIPLRAYAKVYDRYTHIMNLNVDQYIKDFEKTEKTIDQVREEVKTHLREKEILEKLIPNSIVIGPFYLITSKIRENLSNKRKALAEAVLSYQTRKVRNKAEDTNNSFREIQRKLFEKPSNMEELHEHREWMKTVPNLLDDKKDDITNVMDEFSLLDEFLYNLSNEDFNMKWGLLSWPWKLTNMMVQVEEQHVEDEERFRKMQITDTSALNDKLDSLIVSIFSALTFMVN